MESDLLLKRQDSPQLQSIREADISIVSPHLIATTTSHGNTLSTAASSTISLGRGTVTPSTTAAAAESGPTTGGIMVIILIVVVILSVISCVAGGIWRCCIQKGRKERAAAATEAKQRADQEQRGRSQYRGQVLASSKDRVYGRTSNDTAVHDVDPDPSLRPEKLNVVKRFETIPEHEEVSRPVDGHSDLRDSNVSPRKAYFYHETAGR